MVLVVVTMLYFFDTRISQISCVDVVKFIFSLILLPLFILCIQESGRKPWHSINFICAHDGFTLADLVTYNDKHNLANGEDNNDGENHNNSWNCGQVNICI